MIVLLSIGQSCKTHVVSNSQSVKSKENSIYIDVLRDIEERGYIRIGTTGDFIPFSYHVGDNKTEYSGIDIQLGKDLASSLGVEAKFVKTSWPTLLDDLVNGLYDISMSGVTIKLERQREGLFSIPYLSSGKAAIARDEDVEKYNSINAINQPGVRVIINPGGTNESFALANFPNAKIIYNENNLTIFQKIVDGKADVMVTDAIETLIQEIIHPELEAINPDQPFNFFEMGYLIPRDHFWKAYVDQWLHIKQKDGSFQETFSQELLRISEMN